MLRKKARHTDEFSSFLLSECEGLDVSYGEPMASHTTFGVGGEAQYFATANTLSALQELLRRAKNCDVDFCIVGKGSNLLVSDQGLDGLVVVLGSDFRNIAFDEDRYILTAGGGVSLGRLTQEAILRSLCGLEFSVGVPGSVGGALFMNAGTRDGCIGDRVVSISYLDKNDNFNLKKTSAKDIEWGYRSSSVGNLGVVVECELQTEKDELGFSSRKLEDALSERKRKQPRGKSCGSVFKNPKDSSAGYLIEKAGLKGKRVGGVHISETHCNFIINDKEGSASDIFELINIVKNAVHEKFGVELECEVKMIGKFFN